MNKLLTVFLLFLLTGLCQAQPRAPQTPVFVSRMAASVKGTSSFQQDAARWRLSRQIGFEPTGAVQREVSWSDKVYDWLTTSARDKQAARVRAVSGYLFNMYVHTFTDGKLPGAVLTLDYAGVLDPLEISGFITDADWTEFYQTHQQEIKNTLAVLFDRRLKVRYAPHDTRNDAAELWFLEVLKNSAVNGKRAGYRVQVPGNQNPAPQEISAQLAGLMRASERKSERLVTVHRRVDVAAAVDQKNRVHKQEFYRSVRAECAACSYVFCQQLCAGLPAESWNVLRVYKIAAVPLKAKQLTPAGAQPFTTPDKKPYPAWQYHEAAIAVVSKDGQTVWLAADSFLFEKPVPLTQWAGMFHADETAFYLYPFQRKESVEKAFKTLSVEQTVHVKQSRPVRVEGREYKPLPVNR